MSLIKWKEVVVELENVDKKNVLELAKSKPALYAALSMSRPENWWGSGVSPETLINIAKEDGIPVSWIPSKDIIISLSEAKDKNSRCSILLKNKDEIIQESELLIGQCDDPWIESEVFLTARAITAFKEGHIEASMALFVSISEPLALWASTPRVQSFSSSEERKLWEQKRKKTSKYRWAADELEIDDGSPNGKVMRRALIAPIKEFFKPFRVENGDSYPVNLSRHAVAHKAQRSHFTETNSLIGLMLTVSLLREQQSWCEEVRFMDNHDDETE